MFLVPQVSMRCPCDAFSVPSARAALGLSSYLPSTLLGMFSLFGFLLLLEVTGQPEAAMGLFRFLEPGYRASAMGRLMDLHAAALSLSKA